MNNKSNSRRINILRDSVARRIAAGEVIDRPQAVVRELLDNSIDAGATEISLFIRGGGIDEIRVVDNGSGMDEDNLRKCFLPHATSKITDFEDIYSTKTLGFRGEALSSIAACSRLSIISSVNSDEPANKLEIYDGKLRDLSPFKGAAGTVISVRDLFYSMPGRRNFLKSSSAESAQCRAMFIEKSLPQLDISFRYFVDDNLKLFLPSSDMKTRVLNAFGGLFHNNLMQTFTTETEGITISAAGGTPSLYRKDRKYIQVFINNRRVSDYSLVQAADYAYSSYLPGGCHSVCFLFLQIPPEHIDFNIHPAKREVKFRNLPAIHHMVTQAIGTFLSRNNSFSAEITSPAAPPPVGKAKPGSSGPVGSTGQAGYTGQAGLGFNPPVNKEFRPTPPAADSIFKTKSLSSIAAEIKHEIKPESNLIYHGQIFSLFLIFEHDNNLLLIDQHAAHERLIFNSLSDKEPSVQDLLVPISFRLEKTQEKIILNNIEEYSSMGFELQQAEHGEWFLNAMPSICSGMEDEVISFFKDGIKDITELKKKLYAMVSCKSAIKDGDNIDDISAIELAAEILKLENPRCPHGRPVIQLISRDQLFKMFGRTF